MNRILVFVIAGLLGGQLSAGTAPATAQMTGSTLFMHNHALVIGTITSNPQAFERLTAYYQQQSPGLTTQQFITIFTGLPLKTKMMLLGSAAGQTVTQALPTYRELTSTSQSLPSSYPSPEAALADFTQKYVALLPSLENIPAQLSSYRKAALSFLQGLGYSQRVAYGLQPNTEQLFNQAVVLAQALQPVPQMIQQSKAFPDPNYFQQLVTKSATTQVNNPAIQIILNAYRAALKSPTPNPLITAGRTFLQRAPGTNSLVNASQYLTGYALQAAGEQASLYI